MTRKTLAIIGGGVVLTGIGWMIIRSPQKPAVPSQPAMGTQASQPDQHGAPTPVTVKAHGHPDIPHRQASDSHEKGSAAQPRSLAASFQARAHQALPSGVIPVAVPWQPHTSWAFVPQAIQGHLWFASRRGTGSWHWTSEDLPGVLSAQFPQPLYDALQWADDLHAHQPGPHLPGSISWRAIAGRVGEPVGWTTQILSANQSPIGGPTLALTVWVPSETGAFHGVYGIETVWNAHNARTGQGALLMLVAAPQVP